VNQSCFVDPAYPTLCPTQPPDATAGQPYATDITFWLPPNFTDTETGFNVDFLLMTITGVSGLPFGMDIEYSNDLGVYHPQDDPYGCARICGTAISPGTYVITISIIAQVEFNNLTINVPKQFPLTLVVQPGAGSNTGFSFDPASGCGSLDVQFDALIDGQGSPVTYAWEFGNGNTSTEASSLQHYGAPGTYAITLQTTIGGHVLNYVSVGGTNDNWCGDVEEPSIFGSCQGSPDIYFVLTDGQGNTYESSHGEDSDGESWNNLGFMLNTPPYAIEFWDEDPISVDDALGTFNIPQDGDGTYPFNIAGGTFGSLQIDLVPQQVFDHVDTVVVFAAPQPVLSYDTLAGELCVSDTGITGITWFNDGDTVLTGDQTCIDADSTGAWWAVVNNDYGCSASSDTIILCPTIEIQQSGEVLYTATGLSDYAWTHNGEPIPGVDGPFVLTEAGGLYTVTATNSDGCLLYAEYVLIITGLPAADADGLVLEVFPIPNDGRFTVRTEAQAPGVLRVCDASGRVILNLAVGSSATVPVDIGDIANGAYFVCLDVADRSIVRRITVRH
jgi:hypothetical protein